MAFERLSQIAMHSFRGVRDTFDLPLPKGQSLVLYGDNGTGKSSLADAIEWFFTGEIALLAKEGRDHAVRHLAATKENPTKVEIQTTGDLGGTCTPKQANKAAIDAAVRETFLLRGRTIADFVDKSKGEKWGALQVLLGLGAIDELRADLQKARAELKRGRDEAAAKSKQVGAALKALDVEAERAAVERALGKLALACGFEVQGSIDDYLRLDLRSLIEAPAASQATRRAMAIKTLSAEIEAESAIPDVDALRRWNENDAASTVDPAQLDLLTAAARFVKGNPAAKTCPVCDKKITAETLAEKLTKSLSELSEHAARLHAAETGARGAVDTLSQLHQERTRWIGKAREVSIELASLPADVTSAVKQAISERRAVDIDAVIAFLDALRAWNEGAREALAKQVVEPETTSQRNQAIEFGQLLVAAKQWSDAALAEGGATRAFDRADAIFEIFQTEQRKYVEEVLDKISAEVGRLFGKLHPGGHVGGVGVETWADKGIELAVDFHGQRQRPPQGVLSESYMNSVAIVLFLAMARTFNERLQFLVLDDVVNSFDVTHRGRLSDLLLNEFSDWQLIILTHDRYFFEQIRRKVKGWAAYQILGWSYEQGPALREHRGATEIDAAIELLDAGAVGDAARRGRRGLEQILKELCEGIEVPLPYRRGNANEFREIATLIDGLRRAMKEDTKRKQFLASIDVTLRELEADSQSVLNAEAHASDAGPSSPEVRTTLERVRSFDVMWTCTQCSSRVWKEQGVRCKCGATPFPPPIAGASAAAPKA